jgi:hypothetical protein
VHASAHTTGVLGNHQQTKLFCQHVSSQPETIPRRPHCGLAPVASPGHHAASVRRASPHSPSTAFSRPSRQAAMARSQAPPAPVCRPAAVGITCSIHTSNSATSCLTKRSCRDSRWPSSIKCTARARAASVFRRPRRPLPGSPARERAASARPAQRQHEGRRRRAGGHGHGRR